MPQYKVVMNQDESVFKDVTPEDGCDMHTETHTMRNKDTIKL